MGAQGSQCRGVRFLTRRPPRTARRPQSVHRAPITSTVSSFSRVDGHGVRGCRSPGGRTAAVLEAAMSYICAAGPGNKIPADAQHPVLGAGKLPVLATCASLQREASPTTLQQLAGAGVEKGRTPRAARERKREGARRANTSRGRRDHDNDRALVTSTSACRLGAKIISHRRIGASTPLRRVNRGV